MSDISEKLAPLAPHSDNRARQTLAQLRQSWGRLSVIEGTDEQPTALLRQSMGDAQVWKLEAGRGSKAVFVLEREGEDP